MNETDFIRGQLAAERSHLQQILQAVQEATPAVRPSRPVALYIDWAGRRLLDLMSAQCSALQAAPVLSSQCRAQLAGVSGAAARVAELDPSPHPHEQAQRLLVLLATWNDTLEAAAGATLPIGHWRRAAHLSADTILEERQLYAAARVGAGLP